MDVRGKRWLLLGWDKAIRTLIASQIVLKRRPIAIKVELRLSGDDGTRWMGTSS
jgi:hypothetical protein